MDALHQLGFGEQFLLRLRGEGEEVVSLFDPFDLIHPLLSSTGFTPIGLIASTAGDIGELRPRQIQCLRLGKRGRGVGGGLTAISQ